MVKRNFQRLGTIFALVEGKEVRVNLDVDVEEVCLRYCKKALRTKTGKTKLGHGSIVVTAVR